MNLDVKKREQFLNNILEFYKNVLTSWIKTGGGQLRSPLTFSNVRKQILWGNRFITFETLLKISYQCISFYLIWFPIPYKFKTLTLYLFFVFFWNNT
jgi:hypothetical protein